ncbi:alpha/beta hydrolase family protein [Streptomyces sp. NPDC127068]|uniref:alpha/beta hydrolase family protein n=1 Tax=Streptomyces sp. NPDC127068 TaxID=3347127 RepID=UPI00365F885A
MPDEDDDPEAAAAATAEEASAFSHPTVPPDATAAYGPHPDQVIDFYAPTAQRNPSGPASAPLVVALHGGAWRAPYDRAHLSPFVAHLARTGLAVASVEYRRGPAPLPAQRTDTGAPAGPVAGRWPDTLDDVAAALDALPGLVARLLPVADVRRTVLTGHSAGGHLALWAASRHALPPDAPWFLERPPALRGVVALAPIADLRTAAALGVCSDAARQFLGGPTAFEARLPYADPAALLPTGIATVLVQGATDRDVPRAVADAYADAAARAGEEVGLTVLPDVGHFPLIDPAADACAVVAEEIAQLAW